MPPLRRIDVVLDSVKRLQRIGATANLLNLLQKQHPADLAEVLSGLSDAERRSTFNTLIAKNSRLAMEALSELDAEVGDALLANRPPDELARLFLELATDDAAALIDRLPDELSAEVLARMRRKDSGDVQHLLGYGDQTAGRIMNPEVFALAEDLTAGEAIEALQRSREVEMVFYLYVVDERRHLVGVVSLRRLLLVSPETPLKRMCTSPSVGALSGVRPQRGYTTAQDDKQMDTLQYRPLDIEAIRKDFPIFATTPPLAFLDNAASTQTPRPVVEAMDAYYDTYRSNIHRGIYRISEEATDQYERAREKVARLINAPRARQIIFTRNTTESINLVAYSWGSANIREGDEIVLTIMEHHSNLVPWQLLAQRTGATLRFVEITDEGLLDFTQFRDLLTEKTKLVAIGHVSNVLGSINPIQSIIVDAHAIGAKVVVDAAQSVPHFQVDVQQLDCDFLAFSGHKMCGPTGIGILYGKSELLEEMPPFLGGGSMIRSVERDVSSYAELPAKFEAGTPSIAEAIGLGHAVDYITKANLAALQVHEQELLKYAHHRLEEIEGITFYGPAPHQKAGVISFNMEGIHPHDVAGILDTHDIAVRAGHHCAQPLMKRLNVIATVRASFYLYNTIEDVDRLYDGLCRAQTLMTRRKV